MKKLQFLVLVGLLCAGGYYFLQKFNIEGLDKLRVTPKPATETAGEIEKTETPSIFPDWGKGETPGTQGTLVSLPNPRPVPPMTKESIRIASFNIQVFGQTKASKPHVMTVLAAVIRQFDVVAIQEIRCQDEDLIPRFVELINQAGRHYDYAVGSRVGRTSSKEQYAFLFDTDRIEIDRDQLYEVDDPDDLLHREPLVGWFRVRGPTPAEAFTFTLVNIHTDPDEVVEEMDVLDDVYRLVRDDGRGEDDIIILGDLNTDDQNLGQLGLLADITCAIVGVPTNTRQTQQYDNLVFDRRSVAEFTGRGGVYDFMREYNLSQEGALEVSDHLPVWAEFSVYEGGASRTAALPAGVGR